MVSSEYAIRKLSLYGKALNIESFETWKRFGVVFLLKVKKQKGNIFLKKDSESQNSDSFCRKVEEKGQLVSFKKK